MNIEELAEVHHQHSVELMKENFRNAQLKREELLLALRHSLAGWILVEATPEQCLSIVDQYRKSPFN